MDDMTSASSSRKVGTEVIRLDVVLRRRQGGWLIRLEISAEIFLVPARGPALLGRERLEFVQTNPTYDARPIEFASASTVKMFSVLSVVTDDVI